MVRREDIPWEELQRLNAQGWSYRRLAEKYGVFTVLPTHTNFAVLRTEKCTEIFEELKKRSICVRCFPKFQMLRITTGSEQENATLLTELEDICADMQA